MKITKARPIIKQHYYEDGESAVVLAKLTRDTDFGVEEAFFCRVLDSRKEKVFTIVYILKDRYGKNYVSEYTHGWNGEQLLDEWLGGESDDE